MTGLRNRDKIQTLFIVKVPPPFQGSTLMNKRVVDSDLLERELTRTIFPLSISRDVSDIGKPSLRKIAVVLRDAIKIVAKLWIQKYELVYFAISPYGPAFFKDAFYVILVKIFSRAQIVFHLHGKGMGSYALKNKAFLWIYQKVFNRAAVICLSPHLIPDVQPFYKMKAYIVNNGIENEVELLNYTKTSLQMTFIYLSNFLQEKGILDLLEAAALIKNKSFKLTFIGAESDITIDDLKRMIREKGIQTHCEIIGPKYGKEKWDYLKAADVFVFPTYYNKECFPVVLLEAFQAGLPVISTYEGGIPDIIDDGRNGFLIKQRDIKALSEKMAWFIDNKEQCLEMGKNASKKFETHYTKDIFEASLLKVLKEILISKPNDSDV